jgi:hypothetical protein
MFWEPSNLVAACRRCNYGDGSRIAAENTRQTIEHLRALVEEQQQQIAQMAERLARYEHPKPPRSINRPRTHMDAEDAAHESASLVSDVDHHRG